VINGFTLCPHEVMKRIESGIRKNLTVRSFFIKC